MLAMPEDRGMGRPSDSDNSYKPLGTNWLLVYHVPKQIITTSPKTYYICKRKISKTDE